jgi:hypothetical protein
LPNKKESLLKVTVFQQAISPSFEETFKKGAR